MDSFGRVIAIILAVILLMLFPLKYVAINQKEAILSHVKSETNEFADEIMLQGYITLDSYKNFVNELDATGQIYDVELVHSKPVDGYHTSRLNTVENFKHTSCNYGFEENNIYSSDSEIQEGFQPLGLAEIKNNKCISAESQVALHSFSLMATHVHTDDCYCGHRHNSGCISGSVSNYYTGPSVNLRGTYSQGETSYTWGNCARYRSNIYCTTCNSCIGMVYFSDYENDYIGYLGTDEIKVTQFYLKSDGTTSSYNTSIPRYLNSDVPKEGYTLYTCTNQYDGTSKQLYRKDNTSAFWGAYSVVDGIVSHGNVNLSNLQACGWLNIFSCPTCLKNGTVSKTYVANTNFYNCNIAEDTTPECSSVVTCLTASSPTQTVIKGNTINTNAVATYLDGHTETVTCTNNYNGNLGTQTVTLAYSGIVDNARTSGTKTCTTTVTTINNTTPVSLTVTPSSYSVYNGTEPTYTVTVTYSNNTTKVITSGYTKTGFTIGAGSKTVIFSYTESGITVSTSIVITVKRNLATCPYGHTYELDDFDTDNGCPTCNLSLKSILASPDTITVKRGDALNINLTATYKDGHTQVITTGWTSNYNSNQVGIQIVTISYSGLTTTVKVTIEDTIQCPICGITYHANNDGSDPGCPICSKKVISITATPTTQNVPLGENIVLEVAATYMDGHKELVTEWNSTFNPYKVGKQTVTVNYQTKFTTVTATVISDSKTTCPICGTVYNPIEYPKGCPVCSKTVDSIEAKLRNGGIQVQYGSELNLAVVLIYRDGHREIAYSDYSVVGYRSDILGPQTLTIKYKNLQTTLDIDVVNTLSKTVCPNGHVYYLNEDGSDPGCPYCNQDTTKNSAESYFERVYTEDILTELYKNGIYYFNDGDYVTVSVTPKSLTIYNKLENMFSPKAKSEKQYNYGGIIGNDEYF